MKKWNFIFATGNAHKVAEVMAILQLRNVSIRTLSEVGFDESIEETGLTFKENAWIKANAVFEKTGNAVIAEDSGLEVTALNYAPGIYSARYAGAHGDDDANIDLLLRKMEGVKDRRAAFRSVLAVRWDDHCYTFEGRVEGRIAEQRMGKGGFGYDPIFIPDGYTETFGLLPQEIKSGISHRARAIEPFRALLIDLGAE